MCIPTSIPITRRSDTVSGVSASRDDIANDSPRPHMVMVVGNRVAGDSRVEKAAITAHRAGYEVTVLGLIHRSVPALGVIDEIPVLRVSPLYAMHRLWRHEHDETQLETYAGAIDDRRRLRRLHARALSYHRPNLTRRIVSTIRRRIEDARLVVKRARLKLRRAVSFSLGKLPIPGIWRRAWPHIADLELAFADAIVDLEPDIVHVHDRHILPGANTAAGILKTSGKAVKWVYDAHEWLPGVEFQGPKAHSTAWLAAESELIGRADAVITVSDELADMLERKHNLKTTPSVVTNSPLATSTLAGDDGRTSVREDCGLDPDTDLLVYVGSIAKVRGIETIVYALPALPDVHLALIAPPAVKRRQEIVLLAMELGVAERIHILDYVPARSVTSYLSSASVGLSPVEPIANYQYSLATKIREYLHARLPIVGSSLKTLTRFLEESGVGAVHRPGDSEDCARVVKEVLANRNTYVESITEELLSEHSWESQEPILMEVWGELAGRPKLRPRTADLRPRLVIGPPVDPTRSMNLLSAVCRDIEGDGEVIDRASLTRRSDRLDKKIGEYRRLVAESDGLILESLQPLFGGLMESPEAHLRHLSDVRSVAMMLDVIAGVDLDELIHRIPDCWLRALDDSAQKRISRQGRTTRRLLNQANVPVLATSPYPMPELGNVTWVPTVVDVVPRESTREGPLQVLVAPGPRAGTDASVIETISKLSSPDIAIHLPSSNNDARNMLRNVDVVIDNLGHGSYTDLGAQAMGYGCVVVSRLDSEVRSLFIPSCPIVDTTPDLLIDLVSGLASDRDRLSVLSKSAVVYAQEVHDGRRSAQIVSATMGWSNAGES